MVLVRIGDEVFNSENGRIVAVAARGAWYERRNRDLEPASPEACHLYDAIEHRYEPVHPLTAIELSLHAAGLDVPWLKRSPSAV